MRLLSVNLGVERDISTKSGRTGFFKVPQDGPVDVTEIGLAGDAIVDRQNHGGPEQAVYLVSKADMAWWSERAGRLFEPGRFGENLTYDGPVTADIALGDRIELGNVLLEVTAPRTPCATFAAVMGDKTAAKAMFAWGRSGFYARVLRPGPVWVGNPMRHIPFEAPRIRVTVLHDLQLGRLPIGITREMLLETPLHLKARAALEAET